MTNVNTLSAASRKRVTRKIHNQLRYLWCWYSDALCEANLAEIDGDPVTAAKWEAQASAWMEEYNELERSIA